MENKKNSFVIYGNWEMPFLSLESDAERGQPFMAIFQYHRTGQVPQLKGEVKGIFNMMQDAFDKDFAKWEKTKSERAAAGQTGGKKSGETRKARAEANASVASPDQANEPVNVTVSVVNNG